MQRAGASTATVSAARRQGGAVLGLLLIVSLAALMVGAGPSDKPKARIVDLQVSPVANELQVSFELLNGFSAATLERISSGLPTTIRYDLKLERIRGFWFNPTIEKSTVQVVAMYNAITREYLVNLKQDGRLTASRVVKTEEELVKAMTIFHGLPAFQPVNSRGRFVVRVRADLGSKTVLAMIPTRIQTEWAESARFRAQQSAGAVRAAATGSP